MTAGTYDDLTLPDDLNLDSFCWTLVLLYSIIIVEFVLIQLCMRLGHAEERGAYVTRIYEKL